MNNSSRNTLSAVTTAIALLATAGCIGMYMMYSTEQQHTRQLEEQLDELQKQEKRSAVMQRVNAQMEEIATEQRRISDEQRKEAVQQTILANEMREDAERERRNAEDERLNALMAERRAVEASQVAQSQRLIAEQRQQQAEYSRRVADTLSHLAMSRSLASMAATQYRTGNRELSELLAYAAYNYTKSYHGDLYHPAIYESLTLISESSRRFNIGHGLVMKSFGMGNGTDLLSVTTYGEIIKTAVNKDKMKSETLFKDNKFDFRDMYYSPQGVCFALSYTGHLVVRSSDGATVVPIGGAVHPFRLFAYEKDKLLVIAQRSIHLFDMRKMTSRIVQTLPILTTVAGQDEKQFYVFSEDGRMFGIGSDGSRFTERKLGFKAKIMSYAQNKENGMEAFGTTDGTIYLYDRQGREHRLVGHRSRVSRVRFEGDQLFSSSFDGTVRLWNTGSQKIEPMTVFNSRQWVISFVFDSTKKYIITGDHRGNLSSTLISPHLMAEKVHQSLKRDLTQEEWDYFIGQHIPYETFKGKEVQP